MTMEQNTLYCECGDPTFVWINSQPVCVTHFRDWLELRKKEVHDQRR